MEYNKPTGFDRERENEGTAQNIFRALSDQDPGNEMDIDGDMLDMHSSAGPALDGALLGCGSDVRIPDGPESTLEREELNETSDAPDPGPQMEVESNISQGSRPEFPQFNPALGKLSPVWEPWRPSCDNDLDIEEPDSSDRGAMEGVLGSVDPETGAGIFPASEASDHKVTVITDEFCGVDQSYPNDQGLDGSFFSSFKQEKPSAVSKKPQLRLSLVDVRQPHSLLRENSAIPSGKEQSPLRHDPFSFRSPVRLPDAPPNVGFPFSPRLGTIPHGEPEAHEAKPGQDKCGNSQSRLVKTAKRHFRSGTISPDNVPLNVPVKMSGMTGETPPTGLRSIEPFRSSSESLAIRGLDSTCLLCTSSKVSSDYHSSLDGNDAERCDERLSQSTCRGAQEGDREVGHSRDMTENTGMRVRGTGKKAVEDCSHSA
ncbi:hypothetical protein C7212DRAFT_362814 [Tuber magnatum]|uniref:Uncharacterized protein n=1 Tax=Tuber magnatum TaxID=42249 RepID=A0A317STP7_9PEZI|nr:hypothetical protein C7212DRAFT_362814 [Tuber magnatum]